MILSMPCPLRDRTEVSDGDGEKATSLDLSLTTSGKESLNTMI